VSAVPIRPPLPAPRWEPGCEYPGATAHQWTPSTSPGVWRTRCGQAVTTLPPVPATGTGCATCARLDARAAAAQDRAARRTEDPR